MVPIAGKHTSGFKAKFIHKCRPGVSQHQILIAIAYMNFLTKYITSKKYNELFSALLI